MLVDRRKALAKSSGSFVLVTGEAGIGKTRLLSEFLEVTRDRRSRNVVNTECLQRAQQPLGPIRAMVSEFGGAVDPSTAPAVIMRALAQVIPESLAPEAVSKYSAYPLEKDQLFAALTALLRSVCEKRATLFTVEDIHWADGSTIEFLAYLAGRMDRMRLLVVATCRSDELERNEALLASMAQLFRARAVHHVTLDPLAADEIRAVVDGTIQGGEPLPEHVARDIERRSEGNPFFAEELVKSYFEVGETGAASPQLPLSIRSSITQRLLELAPDERSLIAHAAVLGQQFDPVVLAAVMERDVDALLPGLRHARELNLLVDDIARGRTTIRFRHALTRQTIYESVPAFEARTIHSQIVATLERLPDSDRFVEELAYHAFESHDAAKTLRYNERAGDAAFSLRALPEALIAYRRAFDAASGADDKARLLERIAGVARVQGHSHDAREALEKALSIRLERGEIDAAAGLVASIVGQRYNLGDQGALAFGEGFFTEHRAALSAPARDHLLVISARVAGALYDFASAERMLSAVSDPQSLAPRRSRTI